MQKQKAEYNKKYENGFCDIPPKGVFDKMRAVVFSDSHGNYDVLEEIMERHKDNADIFIQWQQKDEEPGLSNEWVRDIESDPDYLIFGWALDRSITEIAGPLKFSIRLLKDFLISIIKPLTIYSLEVFIYKINICIN